MRRAFVGALLSLLVAFPSVVLACSCTTNFLTEQLYHPRTVRQWDEARLATVDRFSPGTTIFEGTVEKQDVLTGNVSKLQTEEKYRLVTFRAKRVYRGPSQLEFVVQTGMSSCGFDFETGEQYIVFAYRDDRTGQGLATSICSDTGLLQDSAPMLRVLRGDPAAPEDLLDRETYYHRFRDRSQWGSVCGRVTAGNGATVAHSLVYLVRERHDGFPPRKNAQVSKPDGTYCFEYLYSGTYFLSGEDYDTDREIRLVGSLSENGHPLPISVGVGKSVANVNLVLHEDPRDWIRRHAFVGMVMPATAVLALVAFWLVRRKTRVAS